MNVVVEERDQRVNRASDNYNANGTDTLLITDDAGNTGESFGLKDVVLFQRDFRSLCSLFICDKRLRCCQDRQQ